MQALAARQAWEQVTQREALLVDVSSPRQFAQGHPEGAVNAPLTAADFQAELKRIVADRATILFSRTPAVAERLARQLSGEIEIKGWCTTGIDGWLSEGLPFVHGAEIMVDDLKRRLDHNEPLQVIDVREPFEWRSGVIPGARLLPMGQIAQRLGDIPHDVPVVVVCAIGSRSATVTEFLRRQGYDNVANLVGGMQLWLGARYPVAAVR